MDNFYLLPPSVQIHRLEQLARAALPAWKISEDAGLRLIGYRENAVFEVRDRSQAARYALKIHRDGYHTDAELDSELQWMDALREAGLFTPTYLRTRSGERFHHTEVDGVPGVRQIDLSEWVDGRQLAHMHGEQGSVRAFVDSFYVVGETAARMHQQVRGWTPPSGFVRHAWDESGFFGDQPLWGRFWEIDEADAAQRRLLLRVRKALAADLREFGKAPDRFGLIHADLELENILVSNGDAVVIDFDDCGFGWYLYDLATAIYFARISGEHGLFEELRDAWISGYRSVAELPQAHLAMLPTLVLTRIVTVVGWCHTRRETETAAREREAMIEAACEVGEEYLSQR